MPNVTSLPISTAIGTGAAVDVLLLRDKTVQIGGGAFTGTIQVEGTANGVDWVSEGAAFASAGGIIEISKTYQFIRTHTTVAITAGTPTATATGHYY